MTLFSLAYSNKVKAMLLILCQCLSTHNSDYIGRLKSEAKESRYSDAATGTVCHLLQMPHYSRLVYSWNSS